MTYEFIFLHTPNKKIQNGNGHGNILQSWALLTNRSRVVAFRDANGAVCPRAALYFLVWKIKDFRARISRAIRLRPVPY